MAMIFPLNIVQDGMFVNIIAHGPGFVFGIIVTLTVGSLSMIDIEWSSVPPGGVLTVYQRN